MIYDEFKWNPAVKAWQGRGGSVRKAQPAAGSGGRVQVYLGCCDENPSIEREFDSWEEAVCFAGGMVTYDHDPEPLFDMVLMVV